MEFLSNCLKVVVVTVVTTTAMHYTFKAMAKLSEDTPNEETNN